MDLSMFHYDKNISLGIKDISEPQHTKDLVIRDICFSSPTGTDIKAYIVSPIEEGSYPGIFFTHWLETEAEDSNRTQFLKSAKKLGKKGAISFLIDAFWSYTPKKWKQNPILPWKTDYIHDRDLSIKQVIELRRGFDVLLSLSNLDKNRIAYVGHDFGAMYGSLLTNFNSIPIKAWVLIAGTTSFSNWFKFGSKLKQEEFDEYKKRMAPLDPVKHIGKASPAPILFQYAKKDFFVPEQTALDFYNSAKEPKSIKWYETDHGMNKQAFEDMENWVAEILDVS
ncbi:MAG: alpha/beta hydrolase family protein [Candidatus Hodarchaeales archaeon]|jgi:cephalosporin-C deacetylase-like acetyl esterase